MVQYFFPLFRCEEFSEPTDTSVWAVNIGWDQPPVIHWKKLKHGEQTVSLPPFTLNLQYPNIRLVYCSLPVIRFYFVFKSLCFILKYFLIQNDYSYQTEVSRTVPLLHIPEIVHTSLSFHKQSLVWFFTSYYISQEVAGSG